MVNAAELQALHQQAQQQPDAGSSSAVEVPLVDPFPSMREQDPFPAPHSAAAANGSSNGYSSRTAATATAATLSVTKTPARASAPTAPQPDFESQDLFPSLAAAAPSAKSQWAQKPGTQRAPTSASTWSSAAPVIQRAVHQDSLSIPCSEETSAKLGNIIQRVQSKHKGIKVEASTTRTLTTFVVKGSSEAVVKAAKRELTIGLARNVTLILTIPASLRAFVIGQKGKNLKSITEQTGVRINIPKSDDATAHSMRPSGDFDFDNDEQIEVVIEGDEINARTAKDLLSAIVAERTSRTTQRLNNIEHVFYPFIAGPKNANVAVLEQGRDVVVKVPPRAAFFPPREAEATETAEPKRERDLSIIVSGDRDTVAQVIQRIEANVEEMRRSFRTLSISIPKRQHRFLVGDAAQDILAATDCSIELAPIDDPSDSVTIRGPQAKLPQALTAAIEKANAVRVEVVDVGAAHRDLEHAKVLLRWLSMSGRLPREQGVHVFLPRAAIVESSGVAHVEIVGADETAVARVRAQLDGLFKGVPPSFVTSVDVDPLIHRFIIGKKGSGLAQYSKRGVDVIFPPVSESASSVDGRSDVVLVLGDFSVMDDLPKDKKARDTAAAAILDQVKADIAAAGQQAADLKTTMLQIPSKYHRAILGPNGTTLNAILGEERLAVVKLGSSAYVAGRITGSSADKNKDEDTVTIRGPSSEVERVVKRIEAIAKEAEEDLIVNGHTVEMQISAQHVPHIVGRGGAGITKLRDDLGVKLDIGDASGMPADGAKKLSRVKVVIVGRKENVEEAKRRIENQAEKLADETTVTLKVPANLHGAIIGQGGKYVTRLQENYSVRINFPSPGGGESAQKADEVVIKGGKKGVEEAKAELLDLIEYEKENNNVVLVPVSRKSIARIMGRGGSNVNRLREETEAQIDVDREDGASGSDTTTIRLRGTKKAIAAAKEAILAVAADVDAEATYSVTIPSRFHGQLIGPGGQNLRDIITRAGGDAEAKSATQLIQFPRRGADQTDVVTVRGPAKLAGKVKEELDRIGAELQSRITVGVSVPPSQHRSLMGRIRELQSVHPSVRIIVPGWREYEQLEIMNADELASIAPASVIKIQGGKEACEAVRKEISEAFVSNAQSVSVPRAVAIKLSGGSIVRRLRSDFNVSVDAPKASGSSGKAAEPLGAAPAAAKPPGVARIDDDLDADHVESLPYELSKLDLSSASEEVVTWTLSGRSAASLKEAVAELEDEVKRVQSFTAQARLWVDQRAIPRIVGRGGGGLREIEAQTESSIDIPRDQGGLVIILGTESSVEEARQRIGRIALQSGRNDRD